MSDDHCRHAARAAGADEMTDMMKHLQSLADGVRGMGIGDHDAGARVEARDDVRWAVSEIDRLRLNDAEREAIALMAEVAADPRGGAVLAGYEVAATLRGLLERNR